MTWQQWCKKPGWGWSAAAVVAAAGLWVAWPPHEPAGAAPPAAASAATDSRFPYVGAVSCAAAACHNANGPSGQKFSEYTTWITDDPHHRAYEVLFNEDSRRISKALGIKDAWKEGLCLSCHVHPACRPAANDDQAALLEMGVGCESCHGPAGRWKREHYLPGWQSLSDRDKAAKFGMAPTRDLVSRAKGCVGCHVGAGDRDVNHDLIAAGHPRLDFEFSAFLTNMPKHWQEQGDNARPDFPARAWLVGQVAAAQAALELLAYRADEAHHKPWPEFAEYQCFACHHDLQKESWRQQRDLKQQRRDRLGTTPWGTWYFAMVPQLPGAPPGLGKGLENLKAEMEKRQPDWRKVREQAKGLAGMMEDWMRRLDGLQLDVAAVKKQFAAVAQDSGRLAERDWDGAVQLYLALAALYQAQGRSRFQGQDEGIRKNLEAMRASLDFPTMKRQLGEKASIIQYDSPEEVKSFDARKRFLQALERLKETR